MGNKALFIFEGTLQDFLTSSEKVKAYDFHGNPTVKDAIEAQGVPHVEVSRVHINQIPVEFNYKLQSGDEAIVSPYSPQYWSHAIAAPLNFIVDGHLGKLAKDLRTLGFDCTYDKGFQEQTIARIAEKDDRIVLTRNLQLLKSNKVKLGYWLRSQDPEEQILEVISYFDLRERINPFTRCRICNGRIQPVDKERIIEQLPPMTKAHFKEFFQCQDCLKVYWKGSHYEKMVRFVKSLKKAE